MWIREKHYLFVGGGRYVVHKYQPAIFKWNYFKIYNTEIKERKNTRNANELLALPFLPPKRVLYFRALFPLFCCFSTHFILFYFDKLYLSFCSSLFSLLFLVFCRENDGVSTMCIHLNSREKKETKWKR